MATATGVNQGKTKFLEQFLPGNREARTDAVNEAWRAAGNEGTISDSLVKQARRKLNLTGGGRAKGRPSAAPAAKGKPKAVPKVPKVKAASVAAGAPSRPNGGEGGPTPKKTSFVEDILRREPDANVAAVNRAWSGAGHEGKVSDSVFYNVKKELGGAGGRGATAKSKPEPAAKASAVRSGSVMPEAGSEAASRTSLRARHEISVANPALGPML
jgi:hypothetical protein